MTEYEFTNWFGKAKEEYLKYQGTRKYVDFLHQAVDMGKHFSRPVDLEITLINMYIYHYMKMWERKNNKEFNPENIFKIRLPKWIKIVENGNK